MNNIVEIAPRLIWVGGSDRRLERFENMFPLPNGVSYNSYLLTDEKTVLLDTADSSIAALFLDNVAAGLKGRSLDYLVINHMEPDHCAQIGEIVRRYPDVRLVGNAKTFQLLDQFYAGQTSEANRIVVKEGDVLPTGNRTLRFYFAPMVHWPEVMFTYDEDNGILFSADAFGTFGALSGNLFADELDFDRYWLDEARRYYTNIVGKFGAQVQAVFKKLDGLCLRMICPLHGPVWRRDLGDILKKYHYWSQYVPEEQGVVMFYASMYGNTEHAITRLAFKLGERGVRDIHMYDVSKTHASYIIADAWKYSNMVIAAPTYNLHLYAMMDFVLRDMKELLLRNRRVSILANHSWASAAMKDMTALVESMKGMTVVGRPLDIRSALRDDQEAELDELADAIAASLKENKEQ